MFLYDLQQPWHHGSPLTRFSGRLYNAGVNRRERTPLFASSIQMLLQTSGYLPPIIPALSPIASEIRR